jgi:O-antigen/teichoic acid export membrane protein
LKPSSKDAENGKQKRLERKLPSIRNVAAYYGGTIAEAGVFFLLTPFLLRRLGLTAFGLWWLAVSLADWLQLCDFGLREAVF